MKFPGAGPVPDIIKGSAMTLLLFLAYVSLPVAGVLGGLLSPAPAAFYLLKNGKAAGFTIVAITAAVLLVVVDPAATVLYLLEAAVISLALPLFLDRGMEASRAVMLTVAINVVLVVAAMASYGAIQGVDVLALIRKGIDVSITQTTALYEKGGVKGDDLEMFRQAMRQAGELISRIYPALLIVALMVITLITLAMLTRQAAKLPRPLATEDFRQFRNPDQLVWVLILAGFAMLAPVKVLPTVALNLLIVILTLYFIQGVAIVAHFFNRMATPSFLRVIFYLILVLQPYLTIAVAIIGIFDLWGNFRTPRTS
jgi:uncharacterized protein YybS (DUF2232 family)